MTPYLSDAPDPAGPASRPATAARSPMRIDVEADPAIDQQTRTYAEYRLFAALAPALDARRVARARLVLRRARTGRGGARTVCAVALEAPDRAVTRFIAAGSHPYQAINRAVDGVRHATRPPEGADRGLPPADGVE